jgi:hypothetical protein
VTNRSGNCAAVATAAVFLAALGAVATAQQSPAAPAVVSWYGDPSAPNISGVWVRTDAAERGSKEGWKPWPPPLKGAFAATWKKRVAEAAAGKRTDDPARGCLPPGMPRFMTGTNGPLLIIQTPGRVTLYRDGAPVRRVWLDGRSNPQPDDLEDFSNGNAIGHYEGQELVTEIIGIKDYPIDSTGMPHSEKLKIVERLHRVDEQTLRADITLTDPLAYARPMTTTVTYKALNDPLWEPREFICTPGTNYHPDRYVR